MKPHNGRLAHREGQGFGGRVVARRAVAQDIVLVPVEYCCFAHPQKGFLDDNVLR